MILAAIHVSRILNFLQSNYDKMRVDLLSYPAYVLSTRLYPLLSIPDCLVLAPHLVLCLVDSLFQPHYFLLPALKLSSSDWLLSN